MKFSIITVCKDSEKTIENTILSVINQTYTNFEYIIIDGVSSDKTLDIVGKYRDKISHVISEADNGLYDAMNKGIKLASGDYLFFLNSDDQFLHDNILELVAEKAENSDAELIYGDIAVLNKQTGNFSIQKHNKFNKIYLLKNTPCQPGCFYKKDAFEKYEDFDTNYKIVSDHEWFLRVFLKHSDCPNKDDINRNCKNRKNIKDGDCPNKDDINKNCKNRENIKGGDCHQYIGFPVSIFNIGGLSTNKNREEKLISERNAMIDKYFTKFERISYEFISKNCRSLTTVPILSDFLNLIFRYKI